VITVDVSGEARADMQLVPLRTSRVSGIVLTSAGQPAARALVSLYPRDVNFPSNPGFNIPSLTQTVPADSNGRFVLNGVPPGAFTLRVEHRQSDAANQRIINIGQVETLGAMGFGDSGELPIVVDGDVDDLVVTTSAPAAVDVSVIADRGVTASLPTGVQITPRLPDRGQVATLRTGNRSNDRMMLIWSGPARLDVSGLPSNWSVKAILYDGEDVTDRTIEPQSGRNSLVQVVLTDRTTEVTGTVAASSFTGGTEPSEVLIFPADPQKWTYPSRYVRAVRVADRNAFTVSGLPPRDDYRIIALDYLDEGEETDTELLERLRERATRFSLKEGERIALDVRLVQR
jgi:hypothetical protein